MGVEGIASDVKSIAGLQAMCLEDAKRLGEPHFRGSDKNGKPVCTLLNDRALAEDLMKGGLGRLGCGCMNVPSKVPEGDVYHPGCTYEAD